MAIICILFLQALELKDEQVSKLTRVREEMDQEITELTAKLFEVSQCILFQNYRMLQHVS